MAVLVAIVATLGSAMGTFFALIWSHDPLLLPGVRGLLLRISPRFLGARSEAAYEKKPTFCILEPESLLSEVKMISNVPGLRAFHVQVPEKDSSDSQKDDPSLGQRPFSVRRIDVIYDVEVASKIRASMDLHEIAARKWDSSE